MSWQLPIVSIFLLEIFCLRVTGNVFCYAWKMDGQWSCTPRGHPNFASGERWHLLHDCNLLPRSFFRLLWFTCWHANDAGKREMPKLAWQMATWHTTTAQCSRMHLWQKFFLDFTLIFEKFRLFYDVGTHF